MVTINSACEEKERKKEKGVKEGIHGYDRTCDEYEARDR